MKWILVFYLAINPESTGADKNLYRRIEFQTDSMTNCAYLAKMLNSTIDRSVATCIEKSAWPVTPQ